MFIEKSEASRVLDFLLTNKNIDLSESGLFGHETLTLLRNIIQGTVKNAVLSEEQVETIIEAFISSEFIFDKNTPTFLFKNTDAIIASISRDINSVDYVQASLDIEELIVKKALESNYILKRTSPYYLRRNYEIALNSIRNNANSLNHIDFLSFDDEEIEKLVDEAIELGYELSSESPRYLRSREKVVLKSLKRTPKTVHYVSEEILKRFINPELLKLLALNNFKFNSYEVGKISLTSFRSLETVEKVFEQLKLYETNERKVSEMFKGEKENKEKYLKRFYEFFYHVINTKPKIADFMGVFQYIAEMKWEKYKSKNIKYYANVFGKICIALQKNKDYHIALRELHDLLLKMKNILGDKYSILTDAMQEYHLIIHGEKVGKLSSVCGIIANLSALYISKSKDQIKNEVIDKLLLSAVELFFIPRLDSDIVKKRTLEKGQKSEFEVRSNIDGDEIQKFVINLKNKYANVIDFNIVEEMISKFLYEHKNDLEDIFNPPIQFKDYIRYKKALKLINRLKSHYIKYDGVEVKGYLDIISLDSNSKYIYVGPTFTFEEIQKCEEYLKNKYVFACIKKEIMIKAKSLEQYENMSHSKLKKLATEFPFTDEYFEYDERKSPCMNDLSDAFIDDEIIEPMVFVGDKEYKILNDFVINNNLFWVYLMLSSMPSCMSKIIEEIYEDIDKEGNDFWDDLLNVIDSITEITRVNDIFKCDTSNFNNVLKLSVLSKCSNKSIALLGPELILALTSKKDFIEEVHSDIDIINIATKLATRMTYKKKSTVPYINGATENYKYSMYDSYDESVLRSGIDTNACFKIYGIDHDFLCYTVLNKNGFIIKFVDKFGNFIGRAAGFRNGNAVFINQLRTIYDVTGYGNDAKSYIEQKELITAFIKACENIVSISQNNSDEKDKIDFVFVTKSYSLCNIPSNVENELRVAIGDSPMENESEDWCQFVVNNADILMKVHGLKNTFETDYKSYEYDLICIASTKPVAEIKPDDLKKGDVEAVYEKKRNEIVVTSNIDYEVMCRINKIKALCTKFNMPSDYNELFSIGTTVAIGEDWYIAYYDGNIISSRIPPNCEEALNEYQEFVTLLCGESKIIQ